MATLRQWQAGRMHHPANGAAGLVAFRLAVGALQGTALYGLESAAKARLAPLGDPFLVSALTSVAYLIPALLIIGAGTIRPRILCVWAMAATLIAGGLAYYANWRVAGEETFLFDHWSTLVPAGAVVLLIHALIAGAAGLGRRFPRYADFFAALAKLLIVVMIALLFVGAAEAVQHICSELFEAVGVNAVGDILRRPWVHWPLNVIAFALGAHVVDRRPSLVAGIRTLALTLLGALMPVMALISVCFLCALPFTGLDPLWDTGNATPIVLVAALVLGLLVNAVYQDGAPERAPHNVVRATARVGSIAMAVLVAIAAYSVWLRVTQYGWSTQRIFAVAAIAVAAWVSLGYAVAAPGRSWMKTLPATNFGAVVLAVTGLLALFTPVADPARLAVRDQIRRGAGDLAQLDLKFLHFDGARYGRAILDKIAAGSDPALAKQAGDVAQLKWRFQSIPLDEETLRANMTAYPTGTALPENFLTQVWSATDYWELPYCLRTAAPCGARLLNLDDDKANEILLWPEDGIQIFLLDETESGWKIVGAVYTGACAERIAANLRAGPPKLTVPRWKNLELLGNSVSIGRDEGELPETACPTRESGGSRVYEQGSVIIRTTNDTQSP